MKLKFLLIVFFSLFFKSIFAQQKYPIQTIFKGDSVVILTKEQALRINRVIDEKNFTLSTYKKDIFLLNDTIKKIKWKLVTSEAEMQRKFTKVKDSLNSANNLVLESNRKIEYYQQEMKRIEKLEYIDKKVRRRVTVGIGAALVTWWTIFLMNVIK